MGRTSGGYTIVEVMIVLAVSGVLLFSALTIVGGQQQRTDFNQAMQDIVSMIQNYTSQIQAGSYPSLEGHNCQVVALGGVSGSRPQIGGSASDQCIVLGRVFQVEYGSGTIYSYPVMGAHFNSGGQAITGIDDPGANPEPITNSGLFDTYTIGGGATVTASNDSAGNDDLVGIYSQSESSGNASGNQALTMRVYPYPGQTYPGQNSHLNWCVQETNQGGLNCTAANIQTVNRWNLCVSDGSKLAAIEVSTNPSGVTANINYSPASGECD